MTTILLTGKDGQLGFELRRALAPLGELIAVGRAECDLADATELRGLVRSVKPQIIVNAAAYTAVDMAESEKALAYAINADAVGVLGEEAQACGALVVHYSTDYVFDGTKPGFYVETDEPKPLNVYGASKLAGEAALQASGARHFIFRASWVMGAHGANFAKTILRLAAQRESLNVVVDQFGVPTPAALLADVSAHALWKTLHCQVDDTSSGVYHVAPAGTTNWCEYACLIVARARAAGRQLMLKESAIQPIPSCEYPTPAKRPMNSRLDTRKTCKAFGVHLSDWREGVAHVLDEIL